MIISASYRTDIPAFFGLWFMRRLREGHCTVENPWNGRKYNVSLTRRDVDGFVFWTRNLRPFRPHLPSVKLHAPFVVQYTITNYPRVIEAGVQTAAYAVEDVRATAQSFGQKVVVWRYDPILITSITPAEWHLSNFSALAAQLEDSVDEVVVSFTHFYRKTRLNLARVAENNRFTFEDPRLSQKRKIISELTIIAAKYRIALTICSQPDLVAGTARAARCIDAERLSLVGDAPLSTAVKGNRPGCLCHASRDIGAYNTCPHGCVYCYAVRSRDQAKVRYSKHNPESDSLLDDEPSSRTTTLIRPSGFVASYR